ncbi:MAG: bacterial Ig-like domain-containing protein [Clostridia bacterium]|nr:bacterial Ig-like domain-containing protein [Clostridia bacterium]
MKSNFIFKRAMSAVLLVTMLFCAVPVSVFAEIKNGAETYISEMELLGEAVEKTGTVKEIPMSYEENVVRPRQYASYKGVKTLEALVDMSKLKSIVTEALMSCKPMDLSSLRISATNENLDALTSYIFEEIPVSFHIEEYSYYTSGGYFTKIEPVYKCTAKEFQKMYSEIVMAKEDLIKDIRSNTSLSEAKKALLVHDRLALICEYDYNDTEHQYTSYGALVKGIAVCQGYAEAYDYLLGELGIESYVCSSRVLNHAWNIIKINGDYYHVDVTWDDISWDSGNRGAIGMVQHVNFLRSSKGIYATGHTASDYESFPTKNTFDSYFWQKSNAAFQLIGNEIYYIDNETQTLNRFSDTKELQSVSSTWKSSHGTWGNYALLASDGENLYYSLSKDVYKYTISTKTSTKVFSPTLSTNENIYGLEYTGGYLICDINDTPPYSSYSKYGLRQVSKLYDGIIPTVSISSTNNCDSSQTVTLNMKDNDEIAGYYWGNNGTYSKNEYFSGDGNAQPKKITAPGTYYLTAIDKSGNPSETASITFYKTTLDANGGSVSLSSVLTPKGSSFTFPTASKPKYKYKGWAKEATATSGVTSLAPTGNKTYYAIYEIIPVTITGVTIAAKPDDLSYYIGESLNTKGLTLKVSYSDGSYENVTTGFTTTGFNSDSAGEKTVTVTYEGIKNTFKVTVIKPKVTLSGSSKTISVGDSFTLSVTTDPADKIVAWATSNSSVASVSKGVITANGEGSAVITATLTYKGHDYSATCKVTVKEPTVDAIEIVNPPAKLNYNVGEALNTNGLKIKVNYTNGTSKNITSGFTVAGYDSSVPGEKTVTVTYQKKTATFTVTINDPPIKEIKIHTLPDKTEYVMGDSEFDSTGLKITIYYKNGTQRNTTSGIKVSGFNTSVPGKKTLTVSYSGVTTTFDITIKEAPISKITVNTLPTKQSYSIGEAFDSTGLKITVHYKSGGRRSITSGFDLSGFDSASGGTKTITVTYEGHTVTFTVEIVEPNIDYIELHTLPKKTEYKMGESFDSEGLKITIYYKNGTKRNTTSGFIVNGFDSKTAGKKTLTLNYNGKTLQFDVVVKERVIVSIQVVTLPAKTDYYIGDALESNGLKIKVNYNNGSSENITSGFELENTSLKEAGKKEITVKYEGVKTQFNVNVKSPSISLSAKKLTMNPKEQLVLTATTDPKGVTVKYSSSDDNIALVVNEGVLVAQNLGTAEITARFTYNGLTYKAVCTVNVVEKTKVKFPDVPDDAWYAEGVSYCASNGYITGTDKGTFNPDGKLTREQFVVILARVAGADLAAYTHSNFKDVQASAWYGASVIWANEERYVNGVGDGSNFGVGQNMTREQLATMFFRYAQNNGENVSVKENLSSYSDSAAISSWAYEACSWAVAAGLLGSTQQGAKVLAPKMSVTRAQAAKIFMSYDAFVGK